MRQSRNEGFLYLDPALSYLTSKPRRQHQITHGFETCIPRLAYQEQTPRAHLSRMSENGRCMEAFAQYFQVTQDSLDLCEGSQAGHPWVQRGWRNDQKLPKLENHCSRLYARPSGSRQKFAKSCEKLVVGGFEPWQEELKPAIPPPKAT
jgi:hypothetical protein